MSFRTRWGFRKAGHSTLTGVTRNKAVKIDEFEKEYQAFVEKLKQNDMTTTETVVEEAATEIVEPVKDEQVETDVNESVDIQQDSVVTDDEEDTEVSNYKKKKRK